MREGKSRCKPRTNLQYNSGQRRMTEKIERLAELVREAATTPHPGPQAVGRNAFTRKVDVLLLWIRRYAPPVHWVGAGTLGVALCVYAWLTARTARLSSVGARTWPDVPSHCVLAVWHDNAPSLLTAIAKAKPRARLAIMIATEPRGDSLTVLCRLLGLHVIRGDWEHHGWQSVLRLARLADDGACVIITPDGGGPRRLARAGALVLAAAAGVPVVPIGADCHPAWRERHKWDRARNPVPFCHLTISMEAPLEVDDFADTATMERSRQRMEEALTGASDKARRALGLQRD